MLASQGLIAQAMNESEKLDAELDMEEESHLYFLWRSKIIDPPFIHLNSAKVAQKWQPNSIDSSSRSSEKFFLSPIPRPLKEETYAITRETQALGSSKRGGERRKAVQAKQVPLCWPGGLPVWKPRGELARQFRSADPRFIGLSVCTQTSSEQDKKSNTSRNNEYPKNKWIYIGRERNRHE